MDSSLSQTTVLIPAAGRVPEGLLALSNVQNPAMIPVAGRPVIHWTLSYLRGLGLTKFVIAVARRGGFIEEFVDCAFGATCEVTFITPSRAGGLGQTVADLARHVTTPRALVVLGDTHFQFSDPQVLEADRPVVLTGPVEESYRWCVAETDHHGTVKALRDKVQGLPGPLEALIGVYSFPDAKALAHAAAQNVEAATAAGKNAEMAGVLERLPTAMPLKAVRAAEWLDCGNPDRQAASHQSLLQKRAFNELSIDPLFGTITKRSRNVAKFIDEIRYLQKLPKELAVLFPRVVEASTEPEAPFVTLEYYGYPSLADAFVFENVDPGVWGRIFEHLRRLTTRFEAFSLPLEKGAVTEMLLGKTKARLDKLEGPELLVQLVRHPGQLLLNGKKVSGLQALWPRIEEEVGRLEANAKGSVIHGDLCFSNVLYDLRSRICKLLDPRGSFGPAGLGGDLRYDIAKLYHSVHGHYDFLTNDLFRVRAEAGALELEVRAGPQHQEIRRRFEKAFFNTGGFDRREVLVITALLFASMLPLHSDAPKRQLAMYATALRLFDEVFST